ncbi:zinc ribbon domain-containing protein [Marinobacter profundi]|uniref:zinc ribbon domain-containing protein n=1 Tax=Marinobacter profundi TaxID=2666256 RepID=UPI00117E5278|nr:zinc ribbon domain-containing protein [Marinobacter profundi]
MRNEDRTFCKDCHFQLDEALAANKNYSCPSCGSTERYINMSIFEGVNLYDSWGAQSKDPKYPGKRKVRWETFVGWQRSHKLQSMVHKTRTIDRDNDTYQEIVTDPKTGEIIHRCEEPLSKHFGHGSAKSKS